MLEDQSRSLQNLFNFNELEFRVKRVGGEEPHELIMRESWGGRRRRRQRRRRKRRGG
jgi:hypothetical protein